VKFYGVRGTSFFYWFYPMESGHSKYGAEAINGMPAKVPFDQEHLVDICSRASEILDVMIYGGDCIISSEGEIRIIDFNDWPSFAPCRQEAGPYIAKAVLSAVKNHDFSKITQG
jgi:hypothetical protein